MRKIISFFRRLRSEGVPVWNDRGTIAREGRRLLGEGPERYSQADRSSKIVVLVVVAMIAVIITLLVI